MTDRVQALRAQFLHELPQRIQAFVDLWSALDSPHTRCEQLAQLMGKAHALRGTAATFGFDDLADHCGDVEMLVATLVDSTDVLSDGQRGKIGDHVERVVSASDALVGAEDEAFAPASESATDAQTAVAGSAAVSTQASPDAPATARPVGQNRSLVIVDDEREAGEFLAELLRELGWACHLVTELSGLAEAVAAHSPVAVLMDIVFPEGDMAGVEAVANAGLVDPAPAIIFVSVRSDMTARLEAMRAGAAGYFTKPVDIERLNAKLIELFDSDAPPYRVMVVDDEPIQATFNTTILEKAGMVVQAVTQPGKVLEALDAFGPDLLLLDMHMPEINGLELAHVIRQREDGDDMPIVFLTADSDEAIRSQAMSLGVEDYLTKPVKPKALVLAVRSRIDRYRALHAKLRPVERKIESRLVNRDDFDQSLEMVLQQVRSDQMKATLLHIEVADISAYDDAEVAEVIGESLRGDQKVHALEGGAFLVLLPNAAVNVAHRVAAGIAADGQEQFPDLTYSTGICDLGQSDEPSAVLAAAQTACRQASKRGAGRVAVFEAAKDAAVRQEQDKELLGLVQSTLKQRSFKLLFQPVVSLHGEEASYYEVLLRIFDKQGQEIPLSRIISLAEAANLMHVFDRAVVHTLIRTAVEQFDINRTPRFFVNLSGTSARDRSLVPWVKKQMDAVKMPADRLIFQIGAADVLTTQKQTREMITDFAAIGVDCGLSRFALNDEHMELLEGLKTRFVKFDRPTVERLLKEKPVPDDLKWMLRDLREAKRATLVPFVDDAAAMATLWDLRADFVQGYFIGAPSAEFVTPE